MLSILDREPPYTAGTQTSHEDFLPLEKELHHLRLTGRLNFVGALECADRFRKSKPQTPYYGVIVGEHSYDVGTEYEVKKGGLTAMQWWTEKHHRATGKVHRTEDVLQLLQSGRETVATIGINPGLTEVGVRLAKLMQEPVHAMRNAGLLEEGIHTPASHLRRCFQTAELADFGDWVEERPELGERIMGDIHAMTDEQIVHERRDIHEAMQRGEPLRGTGIEPIGAYWRRHEGMLLEMIDMMRLHGLNKPNKWHTCFGHQTFIKLLTAACERREQDFWSTKVSKASFSAFLLRLRRCTPTEQRVRASVREELEETLSASPPQWHRQLFVWDRLFDNGLAFDGCPVFTNSVAHLSPIEE